MREELQDDIPVFALFCALFKMYDIIVKHCTAFEVVFSLQGIFVTVQ